MIAVAVLVPAGEARAARSATASFGILDGRTVHATATTTGVPGGERVVLDGRQGPGSRAAVRATSRTRGGQARLRWRYVPGRGALHLRVRVVRGHGTRLRTLAASPWRTLRTGALRRAAPLAVLDARRVLGAPEPGSRGTLVLRGAARIRTGDVVAVRPGGTMPGGLLVRARDVRRSSGTTVVAAVPATLPQVMPVGDLTAVAPARDPARRGATVARVVRPLPCGGPFGASIAGEVALSGGFRVHAAWRASTSLERPNVTADVRADVRARVAAGLGITGASDCRLSASPLFARPIRLATVATTIGPLPIAVTADGQATLQSTATTYGRLATAGRSETRGSVRVVYDGLESKITGGVRSRTRPYDADIAASGDAEVRVTPTVDLRLLGRAGPRIDLASGVRTSGEIVGNAGRPWWSTTAPRTLGATWALDALRDDLFDPRVELGAADETIARAAGPAGGTQSREAVSSPEALPPGTRVRVRWDGAAYVALHAWDAAGRHLSVDAPRAMEGVSLTRVPGIDTPGNELHDADDGRPLTLGLCLSRGTEANVVLDVREPGGATIRHDLTLRGEGAAALPRIVPAGAPGHLPASGWCGRPGGDPVALGQLTTGALPDARERAATVPLAARGRADVPPIRHTGSVTGDTRR